MPGRKFAVYLHMWYQIHPSYNKSCGVGGWKGAREDETRRSKGAILLHTTASCGYSGVVVRVFAVVHRQGRPHGPEGST